MTYNPWLDAAQRYPHVHIEWHPILPLHGAWAPGSDVILVDESITKAERRCALAHEIAHMDTGDIETDLCWFAARQETNADKLAARRLIDVQELVSVLRYCWDTREVAAELDVTLTTLAIRATHMHPAERGIVQRSMARREAVA